MQKLLETLYYNKEKTETITEKIEAGEPYMDELKKYLPVMNETITCMLGSKNMSLNEKFLTQVLHDLIDGIEREDDVILLDTLRYGWNGILDYVGEELQGERINE